MRKFNHPLIASALAIVVSVSAIGQAGSNDPTFDPGDIGFGNGDGIYPYDVYDLVRQSDGKVIMCGEFQTYNGHGPAFLARIWPDGSRDPGFAVGTGPDNFVDRMVQLPDGDVLIGGAFGSFNGQPASRLARLNPDGSMDAGFSSAAPAAAVVLAMARQADGRILAAGGILDTNDQSFPWIARFNTDGGLDPTFSASSSTVDGWIRALALQPDGDVLVGGTFDDLNGSPQHGIARLNSDGSTDSTFNTGSGANDWVESMLLKADGTVLVGGRFTSFNGLPHGRLVRLTSTGTVDAGFDVGTGFSDPTMFDDNSSVLSLAARPDGRLLVGGTFTDLDGSECGGIAQLAADGSLDASFPVARGFRNCGYVFALLVLPDDDLLVGGCLTTYKYIGVANIVRLNIDASLDLAFNAGTGFTIAANDGLLNSGSAFGTAVTSLYVQGDGSFYATGIFHRYQGLVRQRIAHVLPDGTVDAAFDPGLGPFNSNGNGSLTASVVQSDGRVIVCGQFSSFSGTNCGNIVRLGTNGSVDPTFITGSGFNGPVLYMLQQPNGRILVSGWFSSYNGVPRPGLARLEADGSLDVSFIPGLAEGGPLALQPDGRILVNGTVRLNADGSADNTWSVGDGFAFQGGFGTVDVLVLQPDGRCLVGGKFDEVDGQPSNGLARLNVDGSVDLTFDLGTGFELTAFGYSGEVMALALQADGRILAGGRFDHLDGVPRANIARLNSDGSLDISFDPGSGIAGPDVSGDAFTGVLALALQPDERAIAGGFFTSYSGVGRNRIARIITASNVCIPSQLTTTADPVISCGAQNLKFDGTSIIAATDVPGANKYQFRFTNVPGEPAYVRNIAFPTRSFTLKKWYTLPLKAGRTYSVIVRASFDGGATWCPYGPSCTVSVSWSPFVPALQEHMEMVDGPEGADLLIHPNPNSGNELMIRLNAPATWEGPAEVSVTDPMGRTVLSTAMVLEEYAPGILSIGQLSNGTYIVQVRMGDQVWSERLVVVR